VYQLLIFAAVGVIVVTMFRRLPGAYRRGSVFHLIYLGVLFLTQAAHIFGQGSIGFNVQYFGLCLCGLLFYFAHLLNSGDSTSVNIDQNSIFDFLDQAIFILSEEGVIVEANKPAVLWLRALGRKVENVDFKGLLAVLENSKKISVKKLEDSEDSDIHFVGVAIPLIYRMERRAFLMSDGITKGEFITLTDVSRNRLLIDRLRDMAGVDGLTGTANRYRYQDLLRKLDKNDNYPLAVVIGDVNGLKFVNDTYGHHMGDQYIKDIAAVLVDCCPKGSYVARYGGDEFATLLVRTDPDKVEEYISSVNKALAKPIEGAVHQPSISLGYAIKHHGNENLSSLIGQADQKMYADKMARKKAEREALGNA
jgi:diguanylate cyclase (GGDEF)-like protein